MMKHFVIMLLALLCVTGSAVGSADTGAVANDGLDILSPCAFFEGKYTMSSVSDPNEFSPDANCNFLIYDFTAADDVPADENVADAARYRQALIDSGYFKEGKMVVEQLIYTGDQEVAAATRNGYSQGFHVEVFALDERKIRISLVEGISFSDMEAASGGKGTADRQQSTAGSKSVVTNEGLTVLSPEQFLGIEPCDEIYGEDKKYTYKYSNRGYKYHSSGTTNPVDWYRMEEYVNALVASGYYEIMEHSADADDAYWTLRYIGPAKIENTFALYYGMSDQAAIAVRSFIGDIKVYYSRDILTADIGETQERLGEYVVSTKQNANGGSGGSCTYCGGDGKCDECGGSVWYYDFDFVYVNGVPELQYVRKMCTDANCSYGKCHECGGDGVR